MQSLYQRLLERLQQEFGDDLEGVLLTGSRIHSTPGPNSDLDVHVVIRQPRRKRHNFLLDGHEIEMFINPANQLQREIHNGSPVNPHMFAFGHILYDPQGVLAELQEEARQVWEAGPPELQHLWSIRYAVADTLRDIEDVADDEATATLLISSLCQWLIQVHFQLQHRWWDKPKRLLQELARWDETAAREARTALTSGPLLERVAALRRLAEYILKPVGGPMPLEWEIDWSDVS
ncbi:nucleotidyltransferase-like protein [Thermosporothrix hazakensis]|jgi:predicted nucleotidyltransferase|uniref:Nucleotidyltransferase-like protein n=2 Tax=Thermosporothrix TaxID=768650 RepID=A0A326UDK8_THEHA|nr:nucleotidyltransferase domain-containing protein [Thermosporothrix hazakensis]PZW36134.1 nucleotidyltransferase-like protein [Thermosporothrix hazakensis]BBH88600.1 hypothetical protein KTC_33510 [Thermosporothrix sp. COM3]GCE46785.1 hypothetical protein KTH_16540 [Thermosporothrix hazakensis]